MHIDPNPELVRIRSRDFRLIEIVTLAAGQVLARVLGRCKFVVPYVAPYAEQRKRVSSTTLS